MKFTSLPKRPDIRLSRVGFGASQGGNLGRRTTEEEFAQAVETAWDLGVRYFDTAPHYGLGLSERRLGRALRGQPREEYVLSTKVGRLLVPSPETAHQRDDDGFDVPADVVRRWDFSRDGIMRSLEESLDRIGTDRVDIMYLHDPDDHWTDIVEQGLPMLQELRDQGVVGAIGAGMNQSAMLTRLVQDYDVDIVMCAGRYTLMDQSAASDLLPAAEGRGVAVVSAGVYNSGLLARPRPQADAWFNYSLADDQAVARAGRIADVCERFGLSLPDVAVAFAGTHPSVASTVLGVRNADQAADSVRRGEVSVPADLWRALAGEGLLPQAALSDH